MDLPRSVLCERPVFDPQSRNAPKLSYIMGRQDAATGQGDPRNQRAGSPVLVDGAGIGVAYRVAAGVPLLGVRSGCHVRIPHFGKHPCSARSSW
jgi:hypothetical protein